MPEAWPLGESQACRPAHARGQPVGRSWAFVTTTNAQHELEVYLNLANRLTLTGLNQLWVADITYIRLRTEFVYLAVIL